MAECGTNRAIGPGFRKRVTLLTISRFASGRSSVACGDRAVCATGDLVR
jgi:hypothetical protein